MKTIRRAPIGPLVLLFVLCPALVGLGLSGAASSSSSSPAPPTNKETLMRMRTAVETVKRSPQAYVTLLYGDQFLLGARVLGKSLRDTGTRNDLVALVSDGVSKEAIRLLEVDGWLVEKIDLVENPNHERPERFWGVYTKLKIFNMTHYKKVVYLDADTVVLRSIEDLFKCQKFCANLKHSERLNSGVMVVEPSKELFEDMMAKVSTLPSYTGGDQGFLNSYYFDFPNAHLFDPSLSEEERRSRPLKTMERLSTLYNADVGLYMLANKWMVNGSELRVIHYTLGPLKPWDWWTAWILKPVDIWQQVRVTLEESLPGSAGGQDVQMTYYVWILTAVPIIILLILSRNVLFQLQRDSCGFLWNGPSRFYGYTRQIIYRFTIGSSLPIYSSMVAGPLSSGSTIQQMYTNGVPGMYATSRLPAYLGSVSIFVCFIVAGTSVIIAFKLVPRQVFPWTGMLLVYEWTFFLFSIMYGKYLELLYRWGRRTAVVSESAHQYDSAKGNLKQRSMWDVETFAYGTVAACLAILVLSIPFIFGITALFLRLGLMIGGALVFVAFLTYASEHVAIHWFLRGREHGGNSHSEL